MQYQKNIDEEMNDIIRIKRNGGLNYSVLPLYIDEPSLELC